MSSLPSSSTSLNRHSLSALEHWLMGLGAVQNIHDPCKWTLSQSGWTAEIIMKKDGLTVSWNQNGNNSNCSFSYGLSRRDVEVAMNQGP